LLRVRVSNGIAGGAIDADRLKESTQGGIATSPYVHRYHIAHVVGKALLTKSQATKTLESRNHPVMY